MELVSLSLRNWRNIPRLVLDQLDRPLIVLAGPNRTGKTGVTIGFIVARRKEPGEKPPPSRDGG